jgi:hypothetical protein
VGWLNSLGATSVNVTAFSLVADRLEATISVDGVKSLDLNEYPFFIMMDFDDVNCKEVKPEILQKYLR